LTCHVLLLLLLLLLLLCSWLTDATTASCVSMSNGSEIILLATDDPAPYGSEIILLATDDPAPYVRKATQGMDPGAAWLAIAHTSKDDARQLDATIQLSWETAADETLYQRASEGKVAATELEQLPAKAQPCAVVLMY
jgi:hypothetical protein